MRTVHATAWCLALLAGCSQPGTTRPGGDEEVGPGRFKHAAIHRTSAPWDGPAVQLFLSETPLTEGKLTGPYASLQVYKNMADLSKRQVHLDDNESRTGAA